MGHQSTCEVKRAGVCAGAVGIQVQGGHRGVAVSSTLRGVCGSPANSIHTCCTHSSLGMRERPCQEVSQQQSYPQRGRRGREQALILTPPSHGKILALGLYKTSLQYMMLMMYVSTASLTSFLLDFFPELSNAASFGDLPDLPSRSYFSLPQSSSTFPSTSSPTPSQEPD